MESDKSKKVIFIHRCVWYYLFKYGFKNKDYFILRRRLKYGKVNVSSICSRE